MSDNFNDLNLPYLKAFVHAPDSSHTYEPYLSTFVPVGALRTARSISRTWSEEDRQRVKQWCHLVKQLPVASYSGTAYYALVNIVSRWRDFKSVRTEEEVLSSPSLWQLPLVKRLAPYTDLMQRFQNESKAHICTLSAFESATKLVEYLDRKELVVEEITPRSYVSDTVYAVFDLRTGGFVSPLQNSQSGPACEPLSHARFFFSHGAAKEFVTKHMHGEYAIVPVSVSAQLTHELVNTNPRWQRTDQEDNAYAAFQRAILEQHVPHAPAKPRAHKKM